MIMNACVYITGLEMSGLQYQAWEQSLGDDEVLEYICSFHRMHDMMICCPFVLFVDKLMHYTR